MQTAERRRGRFRWGARVTALALVAAVPVLAATDAVAQVPDRAGAMAASGAVWDRVPTPIPRMHQGNTAVIAAQKFRAFDLQEPAIKAALAAAPHESAAGALSLALPAPGGGFERFAVQRSPVMAPRLAAKHPEIRTYSAEGITDATATARISVTPLGLQASVRGAKGSWYIDPYYDDDRSLYVSYFRRNLENVHGPLREPARAGGARGGGSLAPLLGPAEELEQKLSAKGFAQSQPGLLNATGDQLRVYRLALVSDPAYAADFPGNVTAAKAALINRVTQIYEDETAIRLVLDRKQQPAQPRHGCPGDRRERPVWDGRLLHGRPACRMQHRCRAAQPDRDRPDNRRQQLRHRTHRARRRQRRVRARARRWQHQSQRLHRAGQPGRRRVRGRLRRPRDGPPVQRQPHLERRLQQL